MDKNNALVLEVKPYLKDRKSLAAHINSLMLEDNSASKIAGVLGEYCKQIGMAKVAEKCGIARQSLYEALRSEGNSHPRFETILKVLHVLDIEMMVIPVNPINKK
jgi:probable addiction module antidote protein